MLEHVIGALAAFVIAVISGSGYVGIAFLMAVESACIPLPSEIIMPFSGYLVAMGELNLWLVALAGAIGSVLGSWLAYWLGARGGRRLIRRYGRFVFISPRDLALAERWFERYGDGAIFIGRMLPIVRTFIALPAGVAHMNVWRFNIYTFLGSYLWCLALAWLGRTLGEHWDTLGVYFHRFDAVIVGATLVALALYAWRHIKADKAWRGD